MGRQQKGRVNNAGTDADCRVGTADTQLGCASSPLPFGCVSAAAAAAAATAGALAAAIRTLPSACKVSTAAGPAYSSTTAPLLSSHTRHACAAQVAAARCHSINRGMFLSFTSSCSACGGDQCSQSLRNGSNASGRWAWGVHVCHWNAQLLPWLRLPPGGMVPYCACANECHMPRRTSQALMPCLAATGSEAGCRKRAAAGMARPPSPPALLTHRPAFKVNPVQRSWCAT